MPPEDLEVALWMRDAAFVVIGLLFDLAFVMVLSFLSMSHNNQTKVGIFPANQKNELLPNNFISFVVNLVLSIGNRYCPLVE